MAPATVTKKTTTPKLRATVKTTDLQSFLTKAKKRSFAKDAKSERAYFVAQLQNLMQSSR